MSDLFWPGAERAGDLLTDAAYLAALVGVEQAWLDALTEVGVAPATATLTGLVGPADLAELSAGAEATGNPIPGLAALLRERSGCGWVHRGLTSQDVIDSALMLCLRDAVTAVLDSIQHQVRALVDLTQTHRGTVMVGRTLTQSAVPITFGLKAANWMDGVLGAAEGLTALTYRAQLGGAAGTHAGATELAGSDPRVALELNTLTANALGLDPAAPWHTTRGPFTAITDALVSAGDAWGRIAGDVMTLSRSEILELGEPRGGGSSTMPHKRNPALSVLIRRAAIAGPSYAATVHVAAGLAHDERSAGPWHAEWAALQALGRNTVIAGSQTAEVLAGLLVDAEQMSADVERVRSDLHAEQRSLAGFADHEVTDSAYLGAADLFIDQALTRARNFLEEPS